MDGNRLSPFTTTKILDEVILIGNDTVCIYIGITRPGRDGRVGIGFYNVDEPSTRGFFPVLDGDIIKCWRAFNVLSDVNELNELALSSAIILASRGRLEEWQVKQIEPLSSLFGDLRAFRRHLLTTLPGPETTDYIINGLIRHDVPFAVEGIVKEYWRGGNPFMGAYSCKFADKYGIPRVNMWDSFKMFVGLT